MSINERKFHYVTLSNVVIFEIYLCFTQNAEFELHANQTQLDHMNNKGVQLLEDLKNIPDFDSSGMESDLDEVNLKWETANSVSA